MILEISKYTFKEGTSYKLKNIIASDIFKENYNKGILSLGRIDECENRDFLDKSEENNPLKLYIVQEEMINDGDYDYDDNFIDNWVSYYNYTPINFCPFTGEKIEIKIVDEIDISKEVEELSKEINSLRKYHSLKKRKEYDLKSKELYSLINDSFIFQ